MPNDYYDQFKTLQGIYTDFITPEEASIQRAVDGKDDQDIFKKLMKLFFPSTPSLFSTDRMWKDIAKLGTAPADQGQNEFKNFITSKLRVYYYGGSPGTETETSIFNFYKNSINKGAYRIVAGDEEASYKKFSETIELPEKRILKNKLALFAVDSPAIDLRLRNADKVSMFINYIPSVMMSQAAPFVDVRFSFEKNALAYNREQLSMSQLKFLLGPDSLPEGLVDLTSTDKSAANALIYDASVNMPLETKVITRLGLPDLAGLKEMENQDKPPAPPVTPEEDKRPALKQITTTGMELFTMPHTLVNMDYDPATKNYNNVLNKTLPFGAITNVMINITPSIGLFSYKTATLTLKIFDRSRLVEIADFLNPKLYQKSLIWITYGWRAPQYTDNLYNQFINQYMLKREAFGVRNSSISIDDSGIATVTLSLFTKGAAEFSTISPIAASGDVTEAQEKIDETVAELKKLIEQTGLATLTSGVKDIRGSQIISAASEGRVASIDRNTLVSEINTLQKALGARRDDPRFQEISDRLGKLYPTDKNSSISSLSETLLITARALASDRTANPKVDLFKSFERKFIENKEKSTPFVGKFDVYARDDASMPRRGKKPKSVEALAGKAGDSRMFKSAFGAVFTKYFASAMSVVQERASENDNNFPEYQIFFYNLNRYAGKAASSNIADFPIDNDKLQKAYAEFVSAQKGENVTLLNFLEIVRDSQFSNASHPIYGFQDFFSEDGTLKKAEKKQADMTEPYLIATSRNIGPDGKPLGKSFSLPAVDFFIESGFEQPDSVQYDLLQSFELAASKNVATSQKHIIRIHIYDKASTPHYEAATIFTGKNADGEEFFFESSDDETTRLAYSKAPREETPTAANVADAVRSTRKKKFSPNDPTRFEQVKKAVAEKVPTILIGSNGTVIKNVTYSSEQDALLSTIMMLRNKSNDESVTTPNGAGKRNIPLRVIPGALSLSLLGCPIVEYMQQFFVDLGTGTTIDNMYNVTGITHSISPGSFSTELKFTFLDAYGKYESAGDEDAYIKNITTSLAEKATPPPPKRQVPAKKK